MSDRLDRPWLCQCGKPLHYRGMNAHLNAHRRKGDRDVHVAHRDGRLWIYWPTERTP